MKTQISNGGKTTSTSAVKSKPSLGAGKGQIFGGFSDKIAFSKKKKKEKSDKKLRYTSSMKNLIATEVMD